MCLGNGRVCGPTKKQHCVHFLISKIDFRSSIGRFVRVVSTYPAPRELSEAVVSKSYSLHCFLVTFKFCSSVCQLVEIQSNLLNTF